MNVSTRDSFDKTLPLDLSLFFFFIVEQAIKFFDGLGLAGKNQVFLPKFAHLLLCRLFQRETVVERRLPEVLLTNVSQYGVHRLEVRALSEFDH